MSISLVQKFNYDSNDIFINNGGGEYGYDTGRLETNVSISKKVR